MSKKTDHEHSCASNTNESWSTFIGCTVRGLLHGRPASAHATRTLIFDCGWGLCVSSNGSFWVEGPEEIQQLVSRARDELKNRTAELQDVLALAGEDVDAILTEECQECGAMPGEVHCGGCSALQNAEKEA